MGGVIGWDIAYGPAHHLQVAVAMFNLGPFFPGSYLFLGNVIELELLDPTVALLAGAGYLLLLDTTGRASGPLLTIAPLGPTALGLNLGVDMAVLNPQGTAFETTTQAAWIKITR